MQYWKIIFALYLFAASVTLAADSTNRGRPSMGPGPSVQCPWVPSEEIQSSAVHCGFQSRTPIPIGKPARFMCGLRPSADGRSCVRFCEFDRCMGP